MTEAISGFTLMETFYSNDVNSEVRVYEHEQSGGQVVWLKNQDPNRAFGIGFMTPPETSQGVAHIVEHCVLAGSRKFPVRDPFMTMMKTSMNTFLNAMTFADMTVYPVASMNEKDLHHLMDVYLDAVFFPNMLENDKIFQQEGWHYTADEETGELGISGVVYNEMRGAYSSPDRLVIQQMTRSLHPQTTYAVDSGGDPYEIPSLTYEEFCQFHQAHYRPENSLAVLYGDLNIDRCLTQIHEGYFKHFTASTGKVRLKTRQPAVGKHCERLYFNGDEDMQPDQDSYYTYAVPFGWATDRKQQITLAVLIDALANTESSPLRQALVEKDYAKDITGYLSNSYYLDFSLILEKINEAKAEEITQIIDKTIAQIVREGLDQDHLEALLNSHEFMLREAGGNMRGVTRVIQLISGWRYDMPIAEIVNYTEIYQDLRSKLGTGYYEAVLEQYFLGDHGHQVLCHIPRTDLFKEADQRLAEKLAEKRSQMSAADFEAICQTEAELLAYQEQEDSKEAKATLPKLELSDVKREITPIPQERVELAGGQRLLFHPQETAGVRYLRFAFPLDTISEDDLPLVSDLAAFLGSVDTPAYAYGDLDTALMKYTNGLSITPKVYRHVQDTGAYVAKFEVCFATLAGEMTNALELLEGILNASDFSDTKRLKNLLERSQLSFEDSAEYRGHSLAIRRLRSFTSQAGQFQERLSGLTYYDHVRSMLAADDDTFAAYQERLKELLVKLFDPERVVLSLTGEKHNFSATLADIEAFLGHLTPVACQVAPLTFALPGQKREAITTNGNVLYVTQGEIMPYTATQKTGNDVVLANILSHNYLHEKIREQGGAYGAGVIMQQTGDIYAYSYRDPHIETTLETYAHLPEALADLDLTQEELDQFIIGSMTSFHYPIVPANVNQLMLGLYFTGQNKASLEARLAEALQTNLEDLKVSYERLSQAMSAHNVVVIGNEDHIQDKKEFFDEIRPLKQ